MMDKKSANGFSPKASEGGIQRKQLPYSVETPYGFHLDLDFLKYVDDIEKGNTIKRVHIQRRIKGPKFSTLPRNFSLPGHGARPAPKDKDNTWTGTSTLGPKPKSRVTEVQQIFDFRPADGGAIRGIGYLSTKPREEVNVGARGLEDRPLVLQSRPNLLRASSMPITVQHRKGSDSSSPDRVVGTPENGSSESVFRASPDLADRRSLPQDRTGLHQQITVALKRVRELEEQVKTIPELKAQICSLREERERLLAQLQAQAQASISSSTANTSADSLTHSLPQGDRGLSAALISQPKRKLDGSECLPEVPTPVDKNSGATKSQASQVDRPSQQESLYSHLAEEEAGHFTENESECKIQILDKSDQHIAVLPHTGEKASQDLTSQQLTSPKVTIRDQDGSVPDDHSVKEEKLTDHNIASDEKLQDKLSMLEARLSQASLELERTKTLLNGQIEENKQKEVKIRHLSEGVIEEVCTTQPQSRARRQSADRGTEMTRVDFTNQETETESPGTVDQGTDTDRICIEVCMPRARAGSIDQQTETERVDTHDQLTDTETEVGPVRQRANSVDQGTETERVDMVDRTTEPPAADRVNQVTETGGQTATDHPQRPRASSVDQGTETERVDTVDRVMETVATQRADQQTETEAARDRRQDGNPVGNIEGETEVVRAVAVTQRLEGINDILTDQDNVADSQHAVANNFVVESSAAFTESEAGQSLILNNETKDKGQSSASKATEESELTESLLTLQSTLETRENTSSPVTGVVEKEEDNLKTLEQTEKVKDKGIVGVTATVTESASVVVADNLVVNTFIPVRPQRGHAPTPEQSQFSRPQLQAPPTRPRRGSSETLPQQAKPKPSPTPTQSPVEVKAPLQSQTLASPLPVSAISSVKQIQPSEPPTLPQIQAQSQAEVRPQPQKPSVAPVEGLSQPKLRAQKKTPSPGSSEAQIQPQSQTTVSRRDSKEQQTVRRRSTESTKPQAQAYSARRGSSEAHQPPRQASSEKDASRRGSGDSQTIRRGSGEAAQRRDSTEAQALRRESGEAQAPRRGSGESPTSPAALGQVVTRLTGLLGEQWAQLGSSSGAQQAATSQQEGPSMQKPNAGKRTATVKGAPAKSVGKATSTAAAAATGTGKPTGKGGPSKMSSIQSQLVSSLSVLSAFYSPGQKAAAANKQQEQGLKSIMKKNGGADKQSSGGAKKNLKFVGVNGGYETTSSEDSSGDEKPTRTEKEEEEEEEEEEGDSPASEVEPDKKPLPAEQEKQEVGAPRQEVAEARAVGEGTEPADIAEGAAAPADFEGGLAFQEEQAAGGKVDQGFVDACIYVKDRMGEVSSPDKEMRQVLLVLYQEWFRVSSQKSSQADMVRLYLRQVSLTTPTLLPYVVNLTDGNGNTALHYSVSHSNFPVVKLLLDTGLCETDNVNKAGYTAVMLAALTATDRPDDLEVMLQLLRQGEVDARSSQAGQTALMLAVSHGRVAMVKLLLSCGADVNSQDRDGSTALTCACEHGHAHIARLLLDTGHCDTGLADKDGQTAMSVATAAPHQEVVDLLKSHADATASHSSSSASTTTATPPPLS